MGKLPLNLCISSQEKNQVGSTRFHLSLYSAQISKKYKIPSIPIIHEGQSGKNHKEEVKWEVNGAKIIRKCRSIFAGAKFLHPFTKLLNFPAFFALLSFWFLICNAEFDLNSTCLDRLNNLGIISL